ncbi:MAG: glycine zipper domain-containing protein, partial [Thermoanaerobaculia bacterium]
ETGEDPGASQDLDARERQLAERQAELDARERRLREAAERQEGLRSREREQAREPERQARTTPRPAPPAPPARPRVEREEPVREETARKPEPAEEVAESRRPAPREDRDERDEEAEREAAELEEERAAREREAREREARETREAEERREEQARREREREEEEESRRPAPLVVNVPAGTVMEVELLEGLSSQTSEAGDIIRARVASDVATDGAVGIPAGSEILGVVTEAVPLGKVGGRAKLGLKFTDLVLPNGRTVPIDATLMQQGNSETRRDAATIGGAAAGGAILGRVLGKKDRSRGAVIGAIIGAAAGAVIASRNGEEVVIPEGTRLDLKLDDEVEVRARQGR